MYGSCLLLANACWDCTVKRVLYSTARPVFDCACVAVGYRRRCHFRARRRRRQSRRWRGRWRGPPVSSSHAIRRVAASQVSLLRNCRIDDRFFSFRQVSDGRRLEAVVAWAALCLLVATATDGWSMYMQCTQLTSMLTQHRCGHRPATSHDEVGVDVARIILVSSWSTNFIHMPGGIQFTQHFFMFSYKMLRWSSDNIMLTEASPAVV